MPGNTLILLLVGLKGAGKTTIGRLLERELGIRFTPVDLILVRLRKAQPHLSWPEFEEQALTLILDSVRDLTRSGDAVCLEATGTTGYFPALLEELQRAFRVLFIRVSAPTETCFRRAQARDASAHLAISDDRLREINLLAEKVRLDWDLEIDNALEWNEQAIIGGVTALVGRVYRGEV